MLESLAGKYSRLTTLSSSYKSMSNLLSYYEKISQKRSDKECTNGINKRINFPSYLNLNYNKYFTLHLFLISVSNEEVKW